MRPRSTRPARWAVMLATFALAASSMAVVAQSDNAGPAMAVEVSGLESGAVVTDNEVAISVTPVGYELSGHAGTPPVDGEGHYHVMLDGGLINMFTTPDVVVSLQNVTPGPHTLMVVPADNVHMPLSEGAAAIEFEYQPTAPLVQITAADTSGATPTISIESPAAGETVSGEVTFSVSTTDLELSEALLGKPNVDGYGHWHLFVDAVEGMGTMMGMSGTDTLTVATDALSPGTHTFFAVLVDNLHAPFDPPVATTVELQVAAEGDQASTSTDEAVAISLTEFALAPNELTLQAGTYTFEGVNDGAIPHALAIEGEGISAQTPSASYGAGESESFSLDLAPGTYEVFCPIPGHKQAGMVGTITVTG